MINESVCFFEAPKAPNVTAQANGLGPGADIDRRAEGAPYVTSAQTCFDKIMSEDPHISRLQRSGEFGLTNPARGAGAITFNAFGAVHNACNHHD